MTDESLKILWTTMWRNSYGSLFKAVSGATSGPSEHSASAAGPDASTTDVPSKEETSESSKDTLAFKFAPSMEGLINPDESSLPVGSDGESLYRPAEIY
jgi:hypothetical protein